MLNLKEILIDTMIASFYKETQLGRSLRNINKKQILLFKRKLKREIHSLIKKVDSNSLKNKDIRNSIKKLAKLKNISIGQSQKIINVYLKVYCILLEKNLIFELDCPLDSKVMKKLKTKELRRTSLKKLNKFEVYEKWQEHIKEKGMGIRLNVDMKIYDKERINSFFK